MRARLAAHTRWAGTPDRTAATAPGRRAALGRFERQVIEQAVEAGEIPEGGTLPPAELGRRARHAQVAHMTLMALRSAQRRRGAATAGDRS